MKNSLVIVLTVIISGSALADQDLEKEKLQRILRELHFIGNLVDEAEQAAEPGQRLRIDYKTLRTDIERIRSGLKRRFSFTEIQPRKIEPIDGDYVLFKGKKQVTKR